jgi:hypothetical protein
MVLKKQASQLEKGKRSPNGTQQRKAELDSWFFIFFREEDLETDI